MAPKVGSTSTASSDKDELLSPMPFDSDADSLLNRRGSPSIVVKSSNENNALRMIRLIPRRTIALICLIVLQAGAACAVETLDCGTQFLRSLPNGATHSFEFSIRAGEGVTVDLTDLADPDGGVMGYRVYDPFGELYDEDCFYGPDLYGDTETGTYRLEVFRCVGSGPTDYTLSLHGTTDTFNGRTTCGRALSCAQDHATASLPDQDAGPQVRSGALSPYRFKVTSTSKVLISARDVSSSIGVLYLRLHGPDGAVIEETCDGQITPRLTPGGYTLLVGDCVGTDAGQYRLIFDTPQCPAETNDPCPAAVAINAESFLDVVSVSNATSSASDPQPACATGVRGRSVWYRYTPPRDGTLLVDTFGSTYDTVLSAYTGSCGSLARVTNGCSDDTGDLTSQIAVPARAGVTQTFMVSSVDSEDGTLAFALQFADGSVEPTPTPTAGTGACCEERADPCVGPFCSRGCEEAPCQTCVCNIDNYCCLDVWDEFCAASALDECESSCVCMGGASPTSTATPTPTRTPTRVNSTCEGDCNGSGEVTIDELIRGVSIALGNATIDTCPSFDRNHDLAVSVDELVRAVLQALNSCRA